MSVSIFVLAATLAGSQPIYGIAVAGDGDSITIGGTRIRLYGIDAPEFDQMCSRAGSSWPCGQAASEQLSKLVTGRDVRCAPIGLDDFGRTLARCSVIGTEVNRAMVALGYAVAFRKYSTEYASAEDAARNAKRGIWSGTFEMPSDFRAASRGQTQPRQVARSRAAPRPQNNVSSGGCVIKGNHSRRGGLIYHLPGMNYYAQTRAEAVFCSEAAAQSAGFRRARAR